MLKLHFHLYFVPRDQNKLIVLIEKSELLFQLRTKQALLEFILFSFIAFYTE